MPLLGGKQAAYSAGVRWPSPRCGPLADEEMFQPDQALDPLVVQPSGGDEFAVLMPETDGTLADAAAARLATSLRGAFDGGTPVTASIGLVSVLKGADLDSDLVLGTADRAMYEAKRAGKNRMVKVAL